MITCLNFSLSVLDCLSIEIINKLLSSDNYKDYNSKLKLKLNGSERIYKYKYKSIGNIYIIVQSYNNIILKHIFTPGILHIITVKDTIIDSNTFTREINNNTLLIENTPSGYKIVKLINKLKPFKPILDNF